MKINQASRLVLLASAVSLAGCDKVTKPFDRYPDLNGDGKPDIVSVATVENGFKAVEYQDHEISVSMSTPKGYEEHTIPYPGLPLEISFKDMNNDERPDILTLLDVEENSWKKDSVRKHEIRVAYQNKDGSFSKPITLKTFQGSTPDNAKDAEHEQVPTIEIPKYKPVPTKAMPTRE